MMILTCVRCGPVTSCSAVDFDADADPVHVPLQQRDYVCGDCGSPVTIELTRLPVPDV